MIILGLDPGLGTTGWGLIQAEGNRLSHIANGQISTNSKESLPDRLVQIDRELTDLILTHQPDGAAVEEVFVNSNPQSTLKLGQARGVILLAAARTGMDVGEYAARLVKKAVVGVGNADKARDFAFTDEFKVGAVGVNQVGQTLFIPFLLFAAVITRAKAGNVLV